MKRTASAGASQSAPAAITDIAHPSLGLRAVVSDIARGRSLYRRVGIPRPRFRSTTPGVAMFDVFDTLITRSTLDPQVVWHRTALLLRESGHLDIAESEYVSARQRAEEIASVNCQGCATLEEIHRELARLVGWAEGAWAASAIAEVDIERELSRPVAAGRALLVTARTNGLRIVFVSDMYLPSVVIRSLLQAQGLWCPGDELWVSSEARARKKTGDLFLLIARTSDVELASSVHVGDQPFADRIAPRWVGVVPLSAPTAEPTRYERKLSRADLPDGLGERLAASAREVRVSQDERSAVSSVAIDVAGPALVAYAIWLLQQAERRGLQRLYFLSRDGEILRLVTEAVARGLEIDIEARYLYGGRMAWLLPATNFESDAERRRFLDGLLRPTVVTAAGVAHRTGLEIDQVVSWAGASAVRLGGEARLRVRAAMESPEVREQLIEHANYQRELARRYFEQERLATDDRVAVADVGWVGNTMNALAALLQPAVPPLSLFFAWTGTEALKGGQDAFLWGGDRPDIWTRMPSVASHIEMFCSGTHGGVSGYRSVEGKIEPVLLAEKSSAAKAFAVEQMQRSIVAYAETVAPALRIADLQVDTRLAVAELLALFRERPSLDEASAWGDFPREEDPQGDSTFPIARPFRLHDARQILRPGPFAGRNLTWPEAALLRTNQPTRAIMTVLLEGAEKSRGFRESHQTRSQP